MSTGSRCRSCRTRSPARAKAPAVYWGDELIAEDGGKGNGMVSYTEMADMLDVEGVPTHKQPGRLLAKEPRPAHEALKAAIKDVK